MLHRPHTGLDLIRGHMPRPLHHGLHSRSSRPFNQLTEHDELHVLGPVRCILDAPWPQTVAQREGQFILPSYLQQVVELLIVGILLSSIGDIFHGQRAAPAHHPYQSRVLPEPLQGYLVHPGMNGDEVHPISGMSLQGIKHPLAGQLLFDGGLIDGHCAQRHFYCCQDLLAHQVQVTSGGQVHHSIRSRLSCRQSFFHLYLRGVEVLGCAQVDIHFNG